MREDEKKDLMEKWQILGLSFMMMSRTPEDFAWSKKSLVTYGTAKAG